MSETAAVEGRLEAVRERIRAAAARAGRRPEEIALVGAAKTQSAAAVVAAARAGLANVGENYVQEARSKIPKVREKLEARGDPVPRWHYIGRLQRNKARDVVRLFDVVETVDSVALAAELDRRARGAERTLDILLQVNLSEEPNKGGAVCDALPELVAACADSPNLRTIGLMTIPALAPDPEANRPVYARLRELAETLGPAAGGEALRELSMGMSGDFEVAIEEGATIVRVGTAIFGARES